MDQGIFDYFDLVILRLAKCYANHKVMEFFFPLVLDLATGIKHKDTNRKSQNKLVISRYRLFDTLLLLYIFLPTAAESDMTDNSTKLRATLSFI